MPFKPGDKSYAVTTDVEDVFAAVEEARRTFRVAVARLGRASRTIAIHVEEGTSVAERVELACRKRGVDGALMKVHRFLGPGKTSIVCCLACNLLFSGSNWIKAAERHPATEKHIHNVADFLRAEYDSLTNPLRCLVPSCSWVQCGERHDYVRRHFAISHLNVTPSELSLPHVKARIDEEMARARMAAKVKRDGEYDDDQTRREVDSTVGSDVDSDADSDVDDNVDELAGDNSDYEADSDMDVDNTNTGSDVNVKESRQPSPHLTSTDSLRIAVPESPTPLDAKAYRPQQCALDPQSPLSPHQFDSSIPKPCTTPNDPVDGPQYPSVHMSPSSEQREGAGMTRIQDLAMDRIYFTVLSQVPVQYMEEYITRVRDSSAPCTTPTRFAMSTPIPSVQYQGQPVLVKGPSRAPDSAPIH